MTVYCDIGLHYIDAWLRHGNYARYSTEVTILPTFNLTHSRGNRNMDGHEIKGLIS